MKKLEQDFLMFQIDADDEVHNIDNNFELEVRNQNSLQSSNSNDLIKVDHQDDVCID